jgi:hypothetical protein
MVTPSRSKFIMAFRDMKRALLAPAHEPFSPWEWWFQLLSAGVADLSVVLSCLVPITSHNRWRSIIPNFALSLCALLGLAYFTSLRYTIRSYYYRDDVKCRAIYGHDAIVIYLLGMSMYHYVKTCFRSPGVVLTGSSNDRQIQGGLWRCPAYLNPTQEQKRLEDMMRCVPIRTNDSNDREKLKESHYHPSPFTSFCQKCQIWRPPRAHHCSVCERCILQFDHHCVWLNQCIGFYNYRNFVMTLFFLMLGCWYGVAILFYPFYEPLRQRIRVQGWHWFYREHGTGFLDLPHLSDMVRMLVYDHNLPPQVVIDIVYPLLFGVGCVMSVFLGMHIKYISKAYTTLEYRIHLDTSTRRSWQQLWKKNDSTNCDKRDTLTPRNPYDLGWWRNLRQVFGTEPYLLLFPEWSEPKYLMPSLSKFD